MSMNFNRVILIGNLTRDPQVRSMPSGAMVAEFGMAMNRRWRTPQGEDQEETCFVDIVCYQRQADLASRFLQKGRQVLVEGRLKLDQWQDRNTGENRSRLRVVAESINFMDRAQGQNGQNGQFPAQGGYGAPQGGYGNNGYQGGYGAQQGGYPAQGQGGNFGGGYQAAPNGFSGGTQGGYGMGNQPAPSGSFRGSMPPPPPSFGATMPPPPAAAPASAPTMPPPPAAAPAETSAASKSAEPASGEAAEGGEGDAAVDNVPF